ncbi:N-acetylglucosamine-6-phosphate deacetylase [Gryllotalpicola reticulitermitis]|uniref:N-acetylglucosamine-6-phosphate deacetylase n=1 Tax=Gryllotalpicola reticulitermitis TaxID=1184153 RepID=A0ABV8QD79_9MICO
MTAAATSWTGRHWRTGTPVTVTAEGGRITSITETDASTEDWLAPGLIDLQVNGIAGFDLNRGAPDPENVVGAARALRSEGVVRFCPTVGTASEEHIVGALRAIATACDDHPEAGYAVAGVHVEGPFISAEDGPRGVHDPAQVRDPDWDEFLRWQDAAGGRIRIVTLAPERPGSAAFIARLREAGVIASIGHTGANESQIAEAIAAGATMSTHLGNGAHAVLPRHPNYIWAQLADDRLTAGFIADGFHLGAAPLTAMLRAKGPRAVLVSDVSSLARMPPGRYRGVQHTEVVLEPTGRLHIADEPRLLAGSASPLLDGIRFILTAGIASLTEAIELASTRPAGFLGLADGGGELREGGTCDLVRFSWDGERLGLRETVVRGESIRVD